MKREYQLEWALSEATQVLYKLGWTLPVWHEQQVEALKAANRAHLALGKSIKPKPSAPYDWALQGP